MTFYEFLKDLFTEELNRILAANTGQPYEKIVQDTERDNYMTAEQALEYGLIDMVVDKRQ